MLHLIYFSVVPGVQFQSHASGQGCNDCLKGIRKYIFSLSLLGCPSPVSLSNTALFSYWLLMLLNGLRHFAVLCLPTDTIISLLLLQPLQPRTNRLADYATPLQTFAEDFIERIYVSL